MVYTLTLNPSIDYYMYYSSIKSGGLNRSDRELVLPGGKGINVSLALCKLDIENVALGICHGQSGEILKSMLEDEGLKYDFVSLKEGNTRINVKLVHDFGITECNAQGCFLSENIILKLYKKLDKIKKDDIFVLSGSVPACDRENICVDIVSYLKACGAVVIADMSGKSLLLCAMAGADMLKPNAEELCGLYNCEITDENIKKCARDLISKGAKKVIVSKGKEGAMFFAHELEIVSTPKTVKENPERVGAGDCAVAGYIYGLLHGYDEEKCLLCATSAGTSHICSKSFLDKELFESMIY